MQTITLKIQDAYELQAAYSGMMAEHAGWGAREIPGSVKRYSEACKRVGVTDSLIASRVVHTLNANDPVIEEMRQAGIESVTIPYDMESPYLELIGRQS